MHTPENSVSGGGRGGTLSQLNLAMARLIVKSSPGPMLLVGRDGSLVAVNSIAETLFGYPPGQMAGAKLEALIPERFRPGHPARRDALFARPPEVAMGVRLDLRALRRDGTEFPVEVGLNPIENAEGQFVFCSVIDITQRVNAEAMFRLAVEACPTAMLMVDMEGRIALVNALAERTFGYGREELMGARVEMLVPERFRHSHKGHRAMFAGDSRPRAMGHGRDLYCVRRDGSEFPIEIGLNPVEKGAERYVLCSIIDIAERKKAEAMFRLAVEACPTAMLMVDMEGRIAMVNALAEQTFGYSREELMGATVEMLVPQRLRSSQAAGGEPFFGLAQPQTMGQGRDLYCMRKDGTEFPIEIGLRPVETSAGRYILSSIVDITERKRYEKELEDSIGQISQAKERAEAATNAKSLFLATMSHEIRTPMNGVLGMAQVLMDTPLSQEQREAAETIKQSADALLAIINDILDFSKIEAGKLELELTRFRLRDVLDGVIRLMGPRAAAAGLHLTAGAPVPEMDCIGDAARLRQVLLNLVSNAIKFTNSGWVRLTVEKADAPDVAAGSYWMFAVEDTGIGIPPEKLDTIFEAFTQGDSSISRRFGGTGLGLTISSRLVSAMGGRMWVESEPGKGTTFRFTVLLRRAAAESAGGGRAEALAGVPVLVLAGANGPVRLDLQTSLLRMGARPILYDDVRNAVAAADRANRRGAPFPVILMEAPDQRVKERELVHRFQRRSPHSGIVVFKSECEVCTAEVCREIGADAYVSRPYDESYLERVLCNLAARVAAARPTCNQPKADGILNLGPRAEGIGELLRILLVEDNVVNQRVAASILTKRGHHVQIARNGEEAVLVTSREPFDAVLMDIQMPVMNGWEATAAIRAREKRTGMHLPIIAMTSHVQPEDLVRCQAEGMDGYLSKPFRVESLLKELYRVRKSVSRWAGDERYQADLTPT